jgi:hypothetical protein
MTGSSDEWTTGGKNVLAPEVLQKIEVTLKNSPVIVEHWFYRGGRAPARLVFDDYEDFIGYINSTSKPGDAIYVWDFSLCREDNHLAMGKVPDAQGRTPRRGAY